MKSKLQKGLKIKIKLGNSLFKPKGTDGTLIKVSIEEGFLFYFCVDIFRF